MPSWLPKITGKRVFIGSCIFTVVTIALVLYDEKRQRDRRQVSVKYRLLELKQQGNMTEYQLQKKRAEQIKQ